MFWIERKDMNEQEVVALMESSQTEGEWNDNCDKVKAACGGYPSFWWPAINVSGLVERVAARWGSSGQIHIENF